MMIEYDDWLTKKYEGVQAVTRRVDVRLKHTTSDIPYYERGVDIQAFTYSSQKSVIRNALRDFSPDLTVSSDNSYIVTYGIKIPITDIQEN